MDFVYNSVIVMTVAFGKSKELKEGWCNAPGLLGLGSLTKTLEVQRNYKEAHSY